VRTFSIVITINTDQPCLFEDKFADFLKEQLDLWPFELTVHLIEEKSNELSE
jgi:hypothetical protein